MPRLKLTDLSLKRITSKPPKAGRVDWFDTVLAGFGLRVSHTGRASWFVFYRVDGQQVRDVFEKYPVKELAAARQEARRRLELVGRGKDPRTEEASQLAVEAQRRANSWRAVVADYLDQRGGKLAKAAEAKAILESEFGKLWTERPAADITPLEAANAVKAIVQRGAPAQARNALGYGRAFYAWAIGTHLYGLEVNPFAAIDADALTGPKKKRKRTLTDAELRDVWQAAGEMGQPYGPLVRLLILLGQRRDEVGEGSWPEIQPGNWRDDPKTETALVIPPERMKMESAHIVPLVPTAVDILRSIPEGGKGDFIFTTTDGELPVDGFSKAKDRLDVLVLRRHHDEVTARTGQTLAVSITTQRAAKGRDAKLVAAGHAPFKATDVGRIVGIKHGSHWGHVRITDFASAKEVAVRILGALASTEPSAEWMFGPEHWTFHDLRRTMRTHLSALPIEDLVRELVIAHAKPGLHQVYDQWSYAAEKRRALELWTARLMSIVDPAPTIVTPIDQARQKLSRKGRAS